jgi:spore coat protein JB
MVRMKNQRGLEKMKKPPNYYKDLEDLQAIDFAILELALYLDTHPDDYDAIAEYNMLTKQRKHIKKAFEIQHGSLTSFGYSYARYPWDWKEAPWPWQV